MTLTCLDGLRTTPLASYLATLGLARCVAEQADPDLRVWWADGVAQVESSVEDLAAWLVDEYRPTPILSPWNEGSGFGRKDKTSRKMLASLIQRTDPRLDAFRTAHEVAAEVGTRAREQAWDKERTVRELRNRCPEDLLDWIDAAVVLAGDTAVFPPLLGTGGNDGRLDFSTNFHQRLLDVLAADDVGRSRSLAWAADALLDQHETALQKAAIGQFGPLAAGGRNSSATGAAESLVNPWIFVLLVEGSLLFAAGVSRRLGSVRRAAMPFTVRTSAGELGSGAASEASRGEIWAPTWEEPMAWPEVRQLFREARASWRGKAVTGAVQMYEATRSFGVARGVDRFIRYGLHQRNGLAFVAVSLDTVDVVQKQEVRLAGPIEDWLERARRAGSSSAVAAALRRAEVAHLVFARNGGGAALVDLLEALTSVELAVGRSRAAAEALVVPHDGIRAAEYLELVYQHVPTPEVRLAASIAAAGCPDPSSKTSTRSMREILLPLEPLRRGRSAWAPARVEGFGVRPLVDVLSDAMVWRAQHPTNGAKAVGLVPWPFGRVKALDRDIHAWLDEAVDDAQVARYVTAFLALDWDGVRAPWPDTADDDTERTVPDPLLSMLQAFCSGALRRPGQDDVLIGLEADWPMLLHGGRESEVATAAVAALRRCGWTAAVPRPASRPRRARLLAALVPHAPHPLRALARIAATPRAESSPMQTQPVELEETPT